MKAHIRFAKITDSASILMLIQELAEFEKEPESVKLTLSDIENFGFGTQPLFQCLVAEINNQVVGMALFYSRFSTWKGPTFHLEDLIVSEASKGQGIDFSRSPGRGPEHKLSNGAIFAGLAPLGRYF